MAETTTQLLRRRITTGPLLVVPGAANALTARLVEEVGFEAVYVTGAGIANTFLGLPDIGLVTLTELTAHVAAIRDATDLPLIVDADTGFGNAVSVRRTVRDLERAGADGIQLEDQLFPKRCGHFGGKQLVGTEEMVQKIHAAVDARRDDDLVIVARTDARATEGFDAAIDRAAAYREAGADVTFVEAPQTVEEVHAVPERLACPQLVNFVEGGKTPFVPLDDLTGYSIALFANAALQGAIKGTLQVLDGLRATGSLDAVAHQLTGWQERQRLVAKPFYDALEERYATRSAAVSS
ncbi:isocitrate lyase/phosphoenolpyruvate mutase family protein [Rhodococcus pseudokoreensis]|uniref:Isocitrate lyase/phosphoenolpyruvate mutase family protein n=1 Tax=Rhodococcus pseudokoreensis TaxID=2811421 RepID=A0A974W7J5_9NOCA|nr:isocitrate lyase/phosphoenolpyruvate mutase family protein [Rhodococcus pseudokoreensis]QSE92566.1 isocitrate lyase/phosphoenolpyruvate mutase family protein [Rhodococcus pseudokoreensis]